ncbi:hypothetical protein [Zavarzinia sp. CC-PAN008]|uniref:hypothetical protein n=1 Tax=Zavarzinia sp. CC-PAN008 TaxID=3243332 RepID=UPI003F743194
MTAAAAWQLDSAAKAFTPRGRDEGEGPYWSRIADAMSLKGFSSVLIEAARARAQAAQQLG